ncbi:hypothetical protein T10_4019 [Trichinella papuae]|uniref:Uncharacterized protein n=1 Tax=Trichinella papuae TaxID=268474 RepID=A0A0V1M3Q5_9BILA|nr:hypothetical protein T10_7808 [Trichinella papuae]KRZ66697.1 hypothetical protein T10_4019 [Trichinella papuae]
MSLLCSLSYRNKNSRSVSAVAKEQSFLPSALTHTATGSKAFKMSDVKKGNYQSLTNLYQSTFDAVLHLQIPSQRCQHRIPSDMTVHYQR